jgi:hypothetical protein
MPVDNKIKKAPPKPKAKPLPKKKAAPKKKSAPAQKQLQAQTVNIHLGAKSTKPRTSAASVKASAIPHIYAPQAASNQVDYVRIADMVKNLTPVMKQRAAPVEQMPVVQPVQVAPMPTKAEADYIPIKQRKPTPLNNFPQERSSSGGDSFPDTTLGDIRSKLDRQLSAIHDMPITEDIYSDKSTKIPVKLDAGVIKLREQEAEKKRIAAEKRKLKEEYEYKNEKL